MIKFTARFVSVFAFGLQSACATHFALDIDQDHKTVIVADSTPAIGADVSKAGITSQDLYNSVYVAANAPVNGSGINVCADSWYDKIAFNKQIAISLNILTGTDASTATPIPIYTVSSDPATCNVAFNHRFVFPPQTLASVSHNNIVAVYAYKVTSTEKLSAYLKDALTLAGNFAPGGQPIITRLTNVTTSQFASDVRNDFNNAFSQNNALTNSLVDISFDPAPPTRVETTYQIIARPLSGWNNRTTGGKAITLGTVVVTIERDLTLIGLNKPGNVPELSTVSETTKIGTVVEDASGKKQFVYDYLDFIANAPPAQAVDNLRNLGSNSTDDSVKKACSQLRVTLDKLGLNRLDTTAFLWRVYTWSDYSGAHQTAAAQGPCLQDPQEFTLVKALGLMDWLKAPRDIVRRHGTPKYCIPDAETNECKLF